MSHRIAAFVLGVLLTVAFGASAQIFGVPFNLRVGTISALVSGEVAGSPMLTRATNGRMATGFVNGATGALTAGFNVTSTSRTGVGAYSLNVTAAGFSSANCVVSSANTSAAECGSNGGGINVSAGIACFNFLGAAQDSSFSFVCTGT